jgi:hypothetical protein
MRRTVLGLQVLLLLCSISHSIQNSYTSICSFGDSYIDTGNLATFFGSGGPALLFPIIQPPYGMTFFGHPTGRGSDGRLPIDFIGKFTKALHPSPLYDPHRRPLMQYGFAAQALGLPFLPPSLAVNQSFRQGVNFATGRATALDRTFFVERGFNAVSPYNISLGDQLGWFDAVKPSALQLTPRFATHVQLA